MRQYKLRFLILVLFSIFIGKKSSAANTINAVIGGVRFTAKYGCSPTLTTDENLRIKHIWLIGLFYLTSIAYGQAPVVKCRIDTTAHFEISLQITQTYNEIGEIQTKSFYAEAIPLLFGFKEFKNEESNKDCTPFGLIYENGQLFMIDSIAYLRDSTGEYKLDLINTKKVRLNHDKVISLKIVIRNETNDIIDLRKIDLLKDIKLPLQWLNISFFVHVPTPALLNINELNFMKNLEDLRSIYIEAPRNEKKKDIMIALSRFENLEKIEIYDFK